MGIDDIVQLLHCNPAVVGDSGLETYPGSSFIGTVEIILQRSSILTRIVLGSHCLEPVGSLLF